MLFVLHFTLQQSQSATEHIIMQIMFNPAFDPPPIPSSSDLEVDFVTWRGHLTKLLTTPYETREGWLLAISRLGGTLYISEVETEAARTDRENRAESHEEMMYWGYKFEQYTCAGKDVSSQEQGIHSTLLVLLVYY